MHYIRTLTAVRIYNFLPTHTSIANRHFINLFRTSRVRICFEFFPVHCSFGFIHMFCDLHWFPKNSAYKEFLKAILPSVLVNHITRHDV